MFPFRKINDEIIRLNRHVLSHNIINRKSKQKAVYCFTIKLNRENLQVTHSAGDNNLSQP